jgi:drug/metabolite transporter (DMT)-like permease
LDGERTAWAAGEPSPWIVAARAGGLPARAELRRNSVLVVAGTGILNVLATVLFLEGIIAAGAARTTVITATAPIFAVPISIFVLHERATWQLITGTLCTVAGVVLLTLSQGG